MGLTKRGGFLPVRPERSEGSDEVRWFVCHGPLMPRGSHFSSFAKKSNQKKATPDDWPFPAMLRKKRNEKNSLSLKQFFVLIAFFFRFSGPINGDSSRQYLIASRLGLRMRRLPFLKDSPCHAMLRLKSVNPAKSGGIVTFSCALMKPNFSCSRMLATLVGTAT